MILNRAKEIVVSKIVFVGIKDNNNNNNSEGVKEPDITVTLTQEEVAYIAQSIALLSERTNYSDRPVMRAEVVNLLKKFSIPEDVIDIVISGRGGMHTYNVVRKALREHI